MSKRILIMAAGTGGHVFPALAIGLALREKGAEVCWLGTDDHLEKEVANTHGFEFFPIAISGLRGKGVFKLLSAPFQLLHALFQSMRVVLKVKPDVVLGFGGFVAGPGGLAAWLLRRKLVIHEQNAVFGFTNKILSYFSSQVFTGFSNTLSRGLIKARCKHARWIGNPIRDAILKIPVPLERFKGRDKTIRLLVMGGSLGARVFNQVVPEALALLDKDCALEVWHHAGKQHLDTTTEAYQKAGVNALIEGFIPEIDKAYMWADIIISRAGALTISELSAVGLPAICVPFALAVDDHQTYNARFLSDHGAAVLLPESEFTPQNLANALSPLIKDRALLLTMAESGKTLEKRDATQELVKELMNE